MSLLLLTFDIDRKAGVLQAIKAIKGVTLTTPPKADGTVRISTKFPTLDAEADAVHAIEDIPGVIDLRVIR